MQQIAETAKIALSQIIATNPYLRIQTDISSLKKSIETVGLINPLTVNESYELLAGGRRYQAIKELGIKEVPVQIVNRNKMEQELISIDENLVRRPLDKIEFDTCLNRGREIYEELSPTANKIDMEVKTLTPAEKKIEREEEENDTTSFAAITAEKTGLSKGVIKSAIKRDALSSQKTKEARGSGDISASQVNELIKLDKEDQDELLPHIQDRPVKEIRKIIATAQSEGIEAAIETSESIESTPIEFIQLLANTKKVNKHLSKISLENIQYEGQEMKAILKSVVKLLENTKNFLDNYEDHEHMPLIQSNEFSSLNENENEPHYIN